MITYYIFALYIERFNLSKHHYKLTHILFLPDVVPNFSASLIFTTSIHNLNNN